MEYKQIILLSMILGLTACGLSSSLKQEKDTMVVLSVASPEHRPNIVEKKEDNTNCLNQSIFDLDFGFKLEFCDSDQIEELKTFSHLKVIRGDQTIYRDTSLTEYELGFQLNPIVIKTDSDSFEVLLEVNDRPCKNFLKRFFVTNNKLTKIDSLPTFEAKPSDLNHDGIKEYAGYREYGEYFGINWSLFTYHPIYYYSLTQKGLKLDTVLTDERNRYICKLKPKQKYHGINVSQTIVDRFHKEIDRIKTNE